MPCQTKRKKYGDLVTLEQKYYGKIFIFCQISKNIENEKPTWLFPLIYNEGFAVWEKLFYSSFIHSSNNFEHV